MSNNENSLSENAFFEIPTAFPPNPIKDPDSGKVLGKIIFSDEPTQPGKEKLESIKNQFKAGEQVFGLAYFPETRKNIGFERGVTLVIRDIEDGYGFNSSFEIASSFVYEPNSRNAETTFYDLDIFVSDKDAWDKALTSHMLKMLSVHLNNARKSPLGANTVKNHRFQVDLQANDSTIARGIFLYDLTSNQEEIDKLYNTHKKTHLKDFKLPESKYQDEELAQKIIKVMNAEGIKAQKVVFTSDNWAMIRHQLTGIVLCRSIWAYIIHEKENDVYHYDEVQFTEDFVGDSFTGVVKKAGYGTANGQILLENF